MRALLVDSDPVAAHAVCMMLRASGIITDHTGSGQEALTLAQRRHYDVILVDPALKDADGNEILGRIHAESRVPVLAVSGAHRLQARSRALDLGAADYIEKPFERAELVPRLIALVEQRADRVVPQFSHV